MIRSTQIFGLLVPRVFAMLLPASSVWWRATILLAQFLAKKIVGTNLVPTLCRATSRAEVFRKEFLFQEQRAEQLDATTRLFSFRFRRIRSNP